MQFIKTKEKTKKKEGEFRSLKWEIDMGEKGIFTVLVNRDPKMTTEFREQPVLAGVVRQCFR